MVIGMGASTAEGGSAVVTFGKRAAVVIRGIICLVVVAVEEVMKLVGDGVVPGGAEVGTGGAEVGTGGVEVER